jgi:hypothetical protein
MDMTKIYTDADFADAIVPEGQVLIFNALDSAGKAVTRYKDESGNFGTMSGSAVIGSSMTFYKCASVDRSAYTWTGYKAVLSEGVYTFEESETSGLVYGTAYTPSPGNIYNADAAIRVLSLWTGGVTQIGLVNYWPLDAQATGMTLGDESPEFGVEKMGIKSMFAANNMRFVTIRLSEVLNAFTLSIWYYPYENDRDGCVVSFGNEVGIFRHNGSDRFSINFGDQSTESGANKWTHLALTFDNGTAVMFMDGVQMLSSSGLSVPASAKLGIGTKANDNSWYRTSGYFAHLRLYDRVLSNDEVATLASEFVPTA